MTNKELYRDFCSVEKDIPIFSQDWWLDAVCENSWDVILIKRGVHIHASMPYSLMNNGRCSLQPQLTQFLGPHIIYPEEQKYSTRLSHEKKIMEELIQQLPNFTYFLHNFSPRIVNWLPFYWHGYSQSTRYTYVIRKHKTIQTVWNEMEGSIRRNIKKAEKNLVVSESDDIELFFSMNNKTFERQNKKNPVTLKQVKDINKACVENNARKIYMAHDSEGRLYSTIFVINDSTTAYYLMGGGEPALRSGGATSLLMWHAIQRALEMKLDFNFEGSMIQPIERYFSSFGAEQQQYFTIVKDRRNLMDKMLFLAPKLLKKIDSH